MIRAIYIGVFLLDKEVVVSAERAQLTGDALARRFPDFEMRRNAQGDAALITIARPAGSARTAPLLVDGTMKVDGRPVDVLIGHTSVAALLDARDIDPIDIDGADRAATADLDAVRRQVARAVEGLTRPEDTRPWPTVTIDHDRFLWWHRLFPATDAGASIHENLRYGSPVTCGAKAIGVVANGFTVFDSLSATEAEEAARGIFAATEDWLELDTLGRQLDIWVSASSARDADLYGARTEVEQASRARIMRMVRAEERARYLRNLGRETRMAAHRAWGIDEQLDHTGELLDSARRAIQDEVSMRRDVRDRERNDLLFAFTLLAALQTLLAVFDFMTNTNESVISTARVAFGALVVVVGLTLLLRAVLSGQLRNDRR